MQPNSYEQDSTSNTDQGRTDASFLATLYSTLQQLEGEISERNGHIEDRDQYVYSDKLERSIDIPIGHDFTPVNWLKRTVEIHKTTFMGRPFQLVSTYDTRDLSVADPNERERLEVENKREKSLAELRRNTVDNIVRDSGGHAIFLDGAESASAVGSWVVKTYYDEDKDKFVISPVEAVENCRAVWSADNFRQFDFFAYVYQISRTQAASQYGLDEDELQTSPLGSPFLASAGSPGQQIGGNNSTAGLTSTSSGQTIGQPMVTVVEGTGKLEGWCSKGHTLTPCAVGNETEVNCLYVGGKLVRLIDDPKKLPRYYIFPNRRERRRSWGTSDITDAAIGINVTYIETLSDWRTISTKVNFPKFKGFNFGPDTTMPKLANRRIQLLPLSEGQDLAPLPMGDGGSIDFSRQLDELKQLYVRETGVSRVLFDDPSVTLNSNQALLTSMKPTSDIAENKKQLWAPILTQLFTDAIHTIAQHKEEFKDLAIGNWNFKVQWPSIMQKEDPVFQQMLLNRWNAGTISLETYLEMQGETKEEVDRMRDDFYDPVTAAAIGHSMGALSQYVLGLPTSTQQFQAPQTATTANNTPGTQPVSQPGSGATPVSPQGALNQAQATSAITGPQGAALQANSLGRLG
jgi:hypothetical protein